MFNDNDSQDIGTGRPVNPNAAFGTLPTDRRSCSPVEGDTFKENNQDTEPVITANSSRKHLQPEDEQPPPSPTLRSEERIEGPTSTLNPAQLRQHEVLSYALSMALSSSSPQGQLNSPMKIISEYLLLLCC